MVNVAWGEEIVIYLLKYSFQLLVKKTFAQMCNLLVIR